MAIESSDLQADGRRDSVIVLNAVLRNQAPFAQEYPSLELTLTDERDEAVARRVLTPARLPAAPAAEMRARHRPGRRRGAARLHRHRAACAPSATACTSSFHDKGACA
jgi:hypothetical protein